jgi:hypothetical protein
VEGQILTADRLTSVNFLESAVLAALSRISNDGLATSMDLSRPLNAPKNKIKAQKF